MNTCLSCRHSVSISNGCTAWLACSINDLTQAEIACLKFEREPGADSREDVGDEYITLDQDEMDSMLKLHEEGSSEI